MLTSLRAGRLGFESLQGKEIFLFFETSRPGLGLSYPLQWVLGFSPGVKRQGSEFHHPYASSADVTIERILYLHSPFSLYGLDRQLYLMQLLVTCTLHFSASRSVVWLYGDHKGNFYRVLRLQYFVR